MEIKQCIKKAFAVIGKEGSTNDGEGFIQRLWEDANSHFEEIEHLAKRDEAGKIGGIWGAMSDFSHSFKPWEENYSKGVYLAGVEAVDGAEAPEGWVKWIIPGYEYLYVKCTEENIFPKVIAYMQEQGIELAGAVHDFNCPEENGQGYMFFPIRKLPNGSIVSPCGIDCSVCSDFNDGCAGCRAIEGQPGWLPYIGKDLCPLYDCALNQHQYKTCGECKELPCQKFVDIRDPDQSDEEFEKSIRDRLIILKGKEF